MYSLESISILKARIGFGSDSTIPVTVSNNHKTGTSGRLFSFFHKLVTLDNLYATVEKINLPEADFNAYLEQLKQLYPMYERLSVVNSPIFFPSSEKSLLVVKVS